MSNFGYDSFSSDSQHAPHAQFFKKVKDPKVPLKSLRGEFRQLKDQTLFNSDKVAFYRHTLTALELNRDKKSGDFARTILYEVDLLLQETRFPERAMCFSPDVAAECVQMLAYYGDPQQQVDALQGFETIYPFLDDLETKEKAAHSLLIATALYQSPLIKKVEERWLESFSKRLDRAKNQKECDDYIDLYDAASMVLRFDHASPILAQKTSDAIKEKLLLNPPNLTTKINKKQYLESKLAFLDSAVCFFENDPENLSFWEGYAQQYHFSTILPLTNKRFYNFQYEADRRYETTYDFYLQKVNAFECASMYPELEKSVRILLEEDPSNTKDDHDYFIRFIQRVTPEKSDDFAVWDMITRASAGYFQLAKAIEPLEVAPATPLMCYQERVRGLCQDIVTFAEPDTLCYCFAENRLDMYARLTSAEASHGLMPVSSRQAFILN